MNDPSIPIPVPSQTLMPTQVRTVALRERLAAAATLLQSLKSPPTEPSLVFSRDTNLPVEAAPVGGGITVGRGTDCTIGLEQRTGVSRRHFSVRPELGAWLLEDLGSRNGTLVDGVEGRVTRRLLRDGDVIFAGELMFLFVNPED